MGQGGGVKVGHGLQSGKHLFSHPQDPYSQYVSHTDSTTRIKSDRKKAGTYPPYVKTGPPVPHVVTLSTQTDGAVAEHGRLTVGVGHGGGVKVGQGLQSAKQLRSFKLAIATSPCYPSTAALEIVYARA